MSENRCIEHVVLFGSLAEGNATLGNNVDLLLLLAESQKPFVGRIEEWRSRIRLDFPVDVFPSTRTELDIPFVRAILRRGVMLFRRGG
ncbi:MAG: nucleotidyltransferase domain-containing protein [Candidatus Caldatribacteriaceae bacterium]